jgi:hypothetical protein
MVKNETDNESEKIIFIKDLCTMRLSWIAKKLYESYFLFVHYARKINLQKPKVERPSHPLKEKCGKAI